MHIEQELEEIAKRAIADAIGQDFAPMLRPANEVTRGDYQLNGLIAAAKRQGKNPRELAEPVALALSAHAAIAKADVAGPGFINISLSNEWIAAKLSEVVKDHARDGVPRVANAETIVIDYSSPNIAKRMHVGHLRSTILGDALKRVLRFVGHDVIADNHVGDWGTQYGLLFAGMKEYGDEGAFGQNPLDELERVYRLATERAKQDAGFADNARAELAQLQKGSPTHRETWQKFVDATRGELDSVYATLGVTFDYWLGESTYEPALPGIVEKLERDGIAKEDEGALCVFFDDVKELSNVKTPFIIRKKDGAFLYSTTDIATLIYRHEHFHATRVLYVVDARQSLHFKQLFALAAKLRLPMKCEHVSFGSVLGNDAKPLKTREGAVVTLSSLLDEAVTRAKARIEEEALRVPKENLNEVARAVGIGAVKYADLRHNRLSDYKFDWDKMISFKGNSAPYLQYVYARVNSLIHKAGSLDIDAVRGEIQLGEQAEESLARRLSKFSSVVLQVGETSQPHLLCEHLYELAREFSVFYESCPILKAEEPVRTSRLALAALSGRQIRRGLELLGIVVVESM